MLFEHVKGHKEISRKDEAFLTFFNEDDEAFREEARKALKTMRERNHRLIKAKVELSKPPIGLDKGAWFR